MGTKLKLQMKTVFITGANGFLGTNLTLKLLEEGYNVKALVRDKRSLIRFSHKNLELIQGDLSDPKHLTQVSKECTIVVHTAANRNQDLLYLKDYEETNVQETKNIIEACTINTIEQLMYIDTAKTYCYGSLDALGNESNPCAIRIRNRCMHREKPKHKSVSMLLAQRST